MTNKIIKSINLLPEFLRTDKNAKFLSSTLDQLIQPPQLERIDGFIGSKLTPTFDATTDNYLPENLSLRKNYQLDPALVIKNDQQRITDVVAFDDLTNEIATMGGKNNNFDRLFRSDFYSYNPHIDWDKLINYREYYWLTTGPDSIVITGAPKNTISTFTVQDSSDGTAFVFNPDGTVADPLITLYRGNTYQFDIKSSRNFYIKSAPSLNPDDQYDANVLNNGTSNDIVTIIVDNATPDTLFYVSGNDVLVEGQFVIKSADQIAALNVDLEIVGKKNYTCTTGTVLSNGMKIRFGLDVVPAFYQNKEFFVEGVNSAIKLIDYSTLQSAKSLANVYTDHFDQTPFDEYPFDNFKSLPVTAEYITINRASRDLNPWSRYNRWVHSSVIEASAVANGQIPVYPANKRAQRPIVEFNADLKLYNFGSIGIDNIDLIDTNTLDAFSTVEGSAGYYVDGVLLEQGHRVVFNADADLMVRGKIYQVNYNIINGTTRLELRPAYDHAPALMSAVGVNLGIDYNGTAWWFNGATWEYAQQHSDLNQPPLFDLFDNAGHSFADTTWYRSNFSGNKIFGYDIGTGSNDVILGFPLKYKNSVGLGSYLFKNYFMADAIAISSNDQSTTTVSTGITYCKFSSETADHYANVWTSAEQYQTPILQFQSVTTDTAAVELTCIDNFSTSPTLDVYLGDNKLPASEFTTGVVGGKFLINFNNTVPAGSNVLFKVYSNQSPVNTGYYEPPLGLTNNPLNGAISSFTLSELSEHVRSMVDKIPAFSGVFPGIGNLRDLPNVSGYGNRLISNANPLAFAQFFIGKKEHSVVNAITHAGDQYNQFKMAFLKSLSAISDQTDPVAAVDQILTELNQAKDLQSPYYLSDMAAYGTDKIIRSWTVTRSLNTVYPILSDYNLTELSNRSILVYHNGYQLLHDSDYKFDTSSASVIILTKLTPGDTIVISDYSSTLGSFIPSTPTKLGLYPKYQPCIYVDNTYVSSQVRVIQGHDGSIMTAYNDFRDSVILEFEKRVYNNIKSQYRAELFDINSINAGAFRSSDYSLTDINEILQQDFIKWAGFYGIEYKSNSTIDQDNPWTWNYTNGYNAITNQQVAGSWRAVYNYFYDTDQPHTAPWKMLGFTEQPDWWSGEYGPAPYTSGNSILWDDIERGVIRQGARAGINSLYARPLLTSMLPVNEAGELIDPSVFLVENITAFSRRQNWNFGDQSPAETAWRKSSYWPFAIQRLLALTKPATYAALMYDPSRLAKNIANQWTYGENKLFLNPKNSPVHSAASLTNGYSVYVAEIGRQRSANYIQELTQDLAHIDFNLFHKVGGFVSKDKLQIVIDAIEPLSASPGALLPPEDYELQLNISNPIKSVAISGLIIQKVNDKFVVKGYNKSIPYFNVRLPIRNVTTQSITIGGISESYVNWNSGSTSHSPDLSTVDTTTANSATTGRFYQKGQLVSYGTNFYRVKVSHQGENTFNSAYYQILSSLPITGGTTVQTADKFDTTITTISYGTEYSTIQSVYDLIIGYGKWLEDQGFVFDEYNADLRSVIDWNFTGKEFLYWTTQNWANNSIIALSPFADQIKYKFSNSVVANIFDNFYEYSLLQANGLSFPRKSIDVNRQDGLCTIKTLNSADGIYFAVLHLIQKEHAMVFNNITQFNDVIYDIETGYRQRRMKLSGFRTANWDGDYFSPGFVYDTAQVNNWQEYTDYRVGDVVRFASIYYSANRGVNGSAKFDFTQWAVLGEKPVAGLLPNFDYKINQFEDFYSLDIDNFDSAQQKMAQHLIGYTPRVYLNNIFTNPIAQYKFYQGFIKEKGTKNAITKLAKASIHNLQGEMTFTEEWAFRVGQYGSYGTYQELEIPLVEGTFIENPQIIKFADSMATVIPNDLICYNLPADLVITPDDYQPATTFSVESSTYENNGIALPVAGYVRLDDVTATAYSEADLLTIGDNKNLQDGDVIWMGFKKNSDWDVVRYVRSSAHLIGVVVSEIGSELTFITNSFHTLAKGDTVSITGMNSQLDGVYVITSIPALTQFTVASTITSVASIDITTPALLFVFTTARFDTFDTLPTDQTLLSMPIGSKFWINNATDGKWAVYQKIENYSKGQLHGSSAPAAQQLGWSISKQSTSDILVAGAPSFNSGNYYGKITIYTNIRGSNSIDSAIKYKLKYTLNQNRNYQTPGTPTEFGYSVVYDAFEFGNTGYGLIFAGAPAASNVKGTGTVNALRYSTGTELPSTRTQEGLIKISSIDPLLGEENIHPFVLLSPAPTTNERFGSSIFVEHNTGTKLLLVGAPQSRDTGTGHVYAYQVHTTGTSNVYYTTTSTAMIDVQVHPSGIVLSSAVELTTGSQWGQCISGSADATVIAVSAPGYLNNTGVVQLFNGTTHLQTVESPVGSDGRFGESVTVSVNGQYLIVSAPAARNADQSYGKVAIYKKSVMGDLFVLTQTLVNPVQAAGMKFGSAIDINEQEDVLVISATGTNKSRHTTFDKAATTLINPTTFDSASTEFYGNIPASGTVYVYNRKADRYVLIEEIVSPVTTSGTTFGHSVIIDQSSIYVGAPACNNASIASGIYQFNKLDSSKTGWTELRIQDDLVAVDNIQKIMLLDSFTEEVITYLDTIDPLKGKIAGIADQELKYKSTFDPAIYTFGLDNTVNDTDINWLDDHVGELWWDLNTAKYMWYEQGEATYRKNHWGKLFPGAAIDVYEWVGSEYLPSEWSNLADTSRGLTLGLSGQPKYVDDSVISVKQVYNDITNSFSNYYYYWVKNKVTVPAVNNRKINSYQVAEIIADPLAYGLQYAAMISSDSLILANSGNLLIGDRIHLNVASDVINNSIPKHTEWLLLQEGSAQSTPTTLLEKKLTDSLVGHDNLGNAVPALSLSSRIRYGIGIRPQQTLFKDRLQALRNLVEFANSVLITNRITGQYSFSNLSAQENIPDQASHAYDQMVEDNQGLLTIDTRQLTKQARLACTVANGKIRSVTVVDAGYGYKVSPTVSVVGNANNAAIISTEIDSVGRIVSASIEHAGSGYTSAPDLVVRPFTVIVLADSQFNNKWTVVVYDIASAQWVRLRTQKYNTAAYWKYTDWQSSTYNKFLDYAFTVNDIYQLAELSLQPGQYVKVKNGGDGRYIILEQTDGKFGTFSTQFNIVYSERGTIQIQDGIWNLATSSYGFEQNNSYDQTLYDQNPDVEIAYILKALKQDIFINELKVNWNLFFFKAVKYALSEQKQLDWAFKTSFINVKNAAGTLDQRPVYKLHNSEYYEQYLAEVKPYHTSIRTFTTQHELLESSNTYTTDFDLPAVYNKITDNFEVAGVDQLTSYPWKSWTDNHSYKIDSISVTNAGTGYTMSPTVVILPAANDVGSGATAEAYISMGRIVSIKVTNAGSGYKLPPTIQIIDSGSTVTVPATAYARLINEKVRTNKIGIKFDRISRSSQLKNTPVTDKFICNGTDTEFVLSWIAHHDKFKISITLDGSIVMGIDYSLVYYTESYGEYSKKYSKIILLNSIPTTGQLLEIAYTRDSTTFNATDRILNYYAPTSGMPGNQLSQLMTGIENDQSIIEGLPFDYTTKWDIEYSPFGKSQWSPDIKYYTKATVTQLALAPASTIFVNSTKGLAIGQHANIISYITNKFNTLADVVILSITATSVTLSAALISNVGPGDIIEFWTYDSTAILDSVIDGGSIDDVPAMPFDTITITGDKFLSPTSRPAPEELVPGHLAESVGINVYTKNHRGAPVVFANSVTIHADTPVSCKLSIVPPNKDSIQVVFNSTIFVYNPTDIFDTANQFMINWETNELTIPPQSVDGILSYTIVSIGSAAPDAEMGLIDSASVTVTGNTTVQLQSLSSFSSVKCVYVTVNGRAIQPAESAEEYGYQLTNANEHNNRAAVNIYNLSLDSNTVQVWFFGTHHEYFNEVTEQLFTVGSTPVSAFELARPPGTIEPAAAQAIVEISDHLGRRRLLPPMVTYYEIIDNNNTTFDINNYKAWPANTFTVSNVRVYINGLTLRPEFDYTVDSIHGKVTINSVAFHLKDVVAIVGMPLNDPSMIHTYDIAGTELTLVTPISNAEIKVITYTDHDDMLMQTERFMGNLEGHYKISRPVFDINYLWVQVNGIPLIGKIDFGMMEDRVTVHINDPQYHNPANEIVITSISSETAVVLGYRIFSDMFNRTHFKRLAKENTTYLTRPLTHTDNEIHVADSSVLTPPLSAKKIPGIIIVDGERIEFFKVTNNVLSQLRRGTLGTSPSEYLEENTKIIDQSPAQTISFNESIHKQTHMTTANVDTYAISASDDSVFGDGIEFLTNTKIPTLIFDLGFTVFDDNTCLFDTKLSPLFDQLPGARPPINATMFDDECTVFDDNTCVFDIIAIAAEDQVSVYYGGRLLRKTSVLHQDIGASYDSPVIGKLGKILTTDQLPASTDSALGDAYIETTTNQVWVYTDSNAADAINGYVYRGLNRLPAEFTINIFNQQLTLNISNSIVPNVKLVIVKKEIARSAVWNTEITSKTTLSLLDSTTDIAKFLQQRPAELPDKYYYGGDSTLMDDAGFALTDVNNELLEGF